MYKKNMVFVRNNRRTLFKSLLAMKLAAMCLLFSVVQVNAKAVAQQVSIQVENVSLREVFRTLTEQTGYDFLYVSEDLREAHPVTLNIKEQPLVQVLENVLANQPLTYEIKNTTVLIRKKPTLRINTNKNTSTSGTVLQQPVSGRVTSDTGEALEGVTVSVQGTTTATTTNAQGNYQINAASSNAVLVFSIIGYEDQQVNVNGRSTVNVEMVTTNEALGEVVVTALGITREKKSLSYSVTEVSGDNFTQARENNLGNALSGRIAGVNATSSATGPAGSSRVIIRGNGSLSGDNQPLYVVNGIPINNANQGTPGTFGGRDMGDGLISINPDDIQSISVLKGGSAAALYGSRAANGVILITTKSGRAQQGIGVEFNSTYTMESPLSIPDYQYEYGSGSRGQKPTTQGEAVANGRMSWGAPLDGEPVIQHDGVMRPYVAQKDNIKNFYDLGSTFSNTLALNGGSESLNFRFSVSNMDNAGIVPNSKLNRKTFNLSANVNLSDKVIFEGRAQYSIEEAKNRTAIADFTANPNASIGVMATSLDVRTLAPGYDENGFETPWNDYNFVTNPYFAVNKVRNGDDRKRFIGSFSARYNFTDYLYARGRLGMDHISRNAANITPSGILYNQFGAMSKDQDVFYETNAELMIGFDKTFGRFSVNAMVGGNQMYNQARGVSLSSGNFNVPFQYFISNGSSQTFSEDFSEWAINSVFGSADLGFDDYLYVNLTGRQDWFSTLSPTSNSLFYPSVGVGFILSEVLGTQPAWLSFAKLRASWAQVGGGAPSPYGLDLVYTAGSIPHLGQPIMTINGSTIPNALKPYTSTTTEAGIELRMLDNRLGADITVYDRTTTNDIVSASVPPSASYNTVSLNVGEMRNRGIEVLLTGAPVRVPDGLNWDVSLNMAYNKNKVIKISDDLTSLAGAQPRTQNAYVYHYEGMPYGMIAGYRRLRDDNGNVVYNSGNGLPLRGPLEALGRGVPPFTVGLSNDFRYKGFSLGFLLDGKFGGVLYTSTNAYATNYGLHRRTVEGGVRESGVTVTGVDENGNAFERNIPAQEYFQGTAFTLTEDFVSSADFIKLRQLTFGYSLPQRLLAGTPLQSASLSLVARNLLLIYSEVDNVDPESSYSVAGNAQGLENFGVPPTRSFGLNLMVRF